MDTVTRLFKNTAALVLSKGIQPFLSLTLVLAIGRVLGVTVFGEYAFVFSYLTVFQILTSFGLKTLITREVARDSSSADKYLVNGPLIAIPLSFAGLLLMNIVIHLLNYPSQVVLATSILSLSLIASTLSECFEGILIGFQRAGVVALAWTIENSLRVGVSLLLVLHGWGLTALVSIFVITRFLNPFICLGFLLRYLPKRSFKVELTFCKQVLKTARVFALILIFVTLYWKADVLMLSKMRGTTAVGYYSAAYKLVWFTMMIAQSFFTAFFPLLSELFKSSPVSFEKSCKKAIGYLLMLALPLAVAVTLLSPKLILLLYGDGFTESMKVLRILIWILIPYCVSEVFAHALLASDNQRIDLRVNGISMLCNVLLNLLLIPKFSYLGAAIATLISINIYLGLQLPFVLKNLINIRSGIPVIRLLFAVSVMGLIIYALQETNPLIALGSSAAVYIILLFLLRGFPQEGRDFIRRIIKPIPFRP